MANVTIAPRWLTSHKLFNHKHKVHANVKKLMNLKYINWVIFMEDHIHVIVDFYLLFMGCGLPWKYLYSVWNKVNQGHIVRKGASMTKNPWLVKELNLDNFLDMYLFCYESASQ